MEACRSKYVKCQIYRGDPVCIRYDITGRKRSFSGLSFTVTNYFSVRYLVRARCRNVARLDNAQMWAGRIYLGALLSAPNTPTSLMFFPPKLPQTHQNVLLLPVGRAGSCLVHSLLSRLLYQYPFTTVAPGRSCQFKPLSSNPDPTGIG